MTALAHIVELIGIAAIAFLLLVFFEYMAGKFMEFYYDLKGEDEE